MASLAEANIIVIIGLIIKEKANVVIKLLYPIINIMQKYKSVVQVPLTKQKLKVIKGII